MGVSWNRVRSWSLPPAVLIGAANGACPMSRGADAPTYHREVAPPGTSGGAVKCVEIGGSARGESEVLDVY
jgi:hypothetical protein